MNEELISLLYLILGYIIFSFPLNNNIAIKLGGSLIFIFGIAQYLIFILNYFYKLRKVK